MSDCLEKGGVPVVGGNVFDCRRDNRRSLSHGDEKGAVVGWGQTGDTMDEGGVMALPRKDRRRIVVDGVRYNWRVSETHRPSNPHPCDVRLYVEHSEHPAGLLLASFDTPHARWVWGFPDHTYAVTPAIVRHVIGYALSHGWAPASARGTFTISHAEHLFPDAALASNEFSPNPDGLYRSFTVPRFQQDRTGATDAARTNGPPLE